MEKKLLYLLSALCALVACHKFNDAELVNVVEFATDKPELLVEDGGGMVSLKVYSNGVVSVGTVEEGIDWLELSAREIHGDGDLEIAVRPNGGTIRMATLRLSLGGSETVIDVPLKQGGLPQYLLCPDPYCIVDGRSEDKPAFSLVTNVPVDKIRVTVDYLGLQKDWISEVALSDGIVSFVAGVNTTDVCRRAKCILSYTDAWGMESELALFVTQSDCNGAIGKPTGVTLIKALGTPEGFRIEDDFLLEGIIVGDCLSPNMALNPSVNQLDNPVKADTTFARRVTYMEGEDGSWGIRLVFDKAADNTLRFGTRIALNLYGATVIREDSPERYTLTGISGWNICSSEPGTDVPEKRCSLSSLTPDDIYTFVTLENMEFAFKCGTYADVMEDYALKSTVNENVTSKSSLLDGWASLLTDNTGVGIYAPVNMLCPWRRSGAGVPQGVGTVSGILVHEKMPRLGDAGKYQIRVIDESGFDMDGNSTLKEYAYWINSAKNTSNYAAINSRYAYNKLRTVIPSNDLLDGDKLVANAEMVCENTVIPASRTADPYTTANYYNRLTADNMGVSSEYVGIGDITTARDWFKWSEEGDFAGYNGFVFTFSTASVDASQWEFAFDFAGGYTSASTARSWPAHWCLEYSIDGGESWSIVGNSVTGGDYVHMRGLPWERAFLNGQWYQTSSQAGMGFSQHSFVLPPEVAGKDEVRLKLRPYDRTIVSLPLVWDDDIEVSQIDYSTDVDIRVRFGFIYIRYR